MAQWVNTAYLPVLTSSFAASIAANPAGLTHLWSSSLIWSRSCLPHSKELGMWPQLLSSQSFWTWTLFAWVGLSETWAALSNFSWSYVPVSMGKIWPAVILCWKFYGNTSFLLSTNIYILVGRFFFPLPFLWGVLFLFFFPAWCHKPKESTMLCQVTSNIQVFNLYFP